MATGATDQDDLIPLILEICEDLFAHASSTTRDELDACLLKHGITGRPGWLIDMVAQTRLQQNPQPGSGTPAS